MSSNEFPKIKEKLLSEIELYANVGDTKIYKFLLKEIVQGDVQLADEFMTSKYGGYTPGQLNQIKIQVFRNQNPAYNPVHAF
jgi:hypothetical protein